MPGTALPVAANDVVWIVLAVVGLIFLFVLLVFAKFFHPWLQAMLSGAPVGVVDLIGMRLRKVDPAAIVQAMVRAKQAGLHVTPAALEALYTAGHDVGAAVESAIKPHSTDVPDPREGGPASLAATAKDGGTVHVNARVTVRTCLGRLLGGMPEETVLGRVAESLRTTVAAAESHDALLADPGAIGEVLMQLGLDTDAAVEIVSIEIVDIHT